MLDISYIRENPKKVEQGAKNKGINIDVKEILDIDEKRRKNLAQLENLRAEKNKATKEISQNKENKSKLISEMKKVDEKADKLKEKQKKLDKKFTELMYKVPNIPFNTVPVGKDDTENVVLRKEGEKTRFDFKNKDYLEIAEKLDLIDVKRAAKVAGSRFAYLKKEAVLLEFALVNLVFDMVRKEGFVPVLPPVLVKPEMMWGMGYIDSKEDADETYYLEKDDLFLVATSEQSIGPMHKDEVLENFPKRYVAFSTCFREEAGSYGKDTRGILRVHQFDKLEMFSFVKPEESKKEHEFLLSLEEKLMKLLGIPYQVINICTGDLGRPAAAKYDIEAWMPSEGRYRETHSTSNCTDFQSRRLNIKYRNQNNKLEFVHTLNGTALAIGRIIIAILENYQQKDGSIKVPEALHKYLNFKVIK